MASAVLWTAGGRKGRSAGWRLFAVAPLFRCSGRAGRAPRPVRSPPPGRPRWVPTVPATCIADPRHSRAGARGRGCVPAPGSPSRSHSSSPPASSWSACWSPARGWLVGSRPPAPAGPRRGRRRHVGHDGGGAHPAGRRRAAPPADGRRAAVGTVLLTGGRGLGTSAPCRGPSLRRTSAASSSPPASPARPSPSLLDARPGAPARRPSGPRSIDVGQLLPHVALLRRRDRRRRGRAHRARPERRHRLLAVVCVFLAGVHRWQTAGEEQQLRSRLRRSEAYFRSLVHSGVTRSSSWTTRCRSPGPPRRSNGSSAPPRPGSSAARCSTACTPRTPPPWPLRSRTARRRSTPSRAPTGLVMLRLRDAAGEWRYLEAGISDLREDADVGAVVLHCRDMTDRHAREQALQASPTPTR